MHCHKQTDCPNGNDFRCFVFEGIVWCRGWRSGPAHRNFWHTEMLWHNANKCWRWPRRRMVTFYRVPHPDLKAWSLGEGQNFCDSSVTVWYECCWRRAISLIVIANLYHFIAIYRHTTSYQKLSIFGIGNFREFLLGGGILPIPLASPLIARLMI